MVLGPPVTAYSYTPPAAFAAAGGRYGVGTDSNVRISLAGELRTLEYSQRLGALLGNTLAMALTLVGVLTGNVDR